MEINIPLIDISYGDAVGRKGIRNGIIGNGIHGPSVIKRPGIAAKIRPHTVALLPGIFYSPNMQAVISVGSDQQVKYGTTSIGAAVSNLDVEGRLTYTENERYIYIRNSRPGGQGAARSDYLIDTTGPSMVEITDADHPGNSENQYAEGVVYLDGYFFVANGVGYNANGGVSTSGARSKIHNSDLGSPTAWTATNYIEAGIEGDPTIAIAKHHNHLVAFGTRTIQYFYNAGNPLGSPLAPRLDLIHSVGLSQNNITAENDETGGTHNRVVAYEDILFFEGATGGITTQLETKSGRKGNIYMMDNFKVKQISTPDVDALMTALSAVYVGMAVLCIQGRPLLLVKISGQTLCLVYDVALSMWYLWDTDIFSGTGDNLVLDGDYATGYIRTINPTPTDADGASTAAFTWSVTTPPINDLKIPKVETLGKRKVFNSMEVVGRLNTSGTSAAVSVAYSDDDYQNFSTARTLTLENQAPRLYRLGEARQRAFRISEATSDTDVEVSALKLDVSVATM